MGTMAACYLSMTDPIHILGPEQSRFDPTMADGGLPPLPGVRSCCVFRASRDTKPDVLGYTYHHHVDMACWKGKLYVGWNTCLKDEDLWPSRELLSVSDDGVHWSDPVEMFPQGVSMPLRMYFYLAPNGRMLIIAGLRPDEGETIEDNKRGLVVRELYADHTLGVVFTLQPQEATVRGPMFDASPDSGFVEACRALLADRVYLEQQDRGKLLGDRAMKWHDAVNWPGGVLPGTKEGEENVKWTFGKALSFYRRPDSAVVGICKMGWTVVSTDDGRTWSTPVVPSTLITGKAKVFAQNHRDGSMSLAYNPSTSQRWPLAIVRSTDGVEFSGMRIVQGELPIQRYDGRFRSIGPQYVRGLSQWSDDGSRDEPFTWLVYSMNKEDIWVSRVSLPIGDNHVDAVYQPKWSSIRLNGTGVHIECSDPFDHATYTRFVQSRSASPCVDLIVQSLSRSQIDVDFVADVSRETITLWPDGRVCRGEERVGEYALGVRVTLRPELPHVERIQVRTGRARGVGGRHHVDAGTDVPVEPIVVRVQRFGFDA